MSIRFADRTEKMVGSDIRVKDTFSEDLIDFIAGKPDERVLPVDRLKPVIDELMEERGIDCMQYSSTEGFDEFRQDIVDLCMKRAGVKCTIDNIQLISGSQQGIYFATQLFVNEGDLIITENPSYTGALNIFEAARAQVIGVDMDEDGMIMEKLRQTLEQHPEAKMIYTIPDFQNPTGVIMSPDRRRQLVELAKEFNIPVIEDSPYSELSYDGPMQPCLKSYDKYGMVVYLGTFSKILCPGLRLGWVCADEPILQKFQLIKMTSDLQCTSLGELIAHKYMNSVNWDEHIESIRSIYREKREVIDKALKENLPSNIKYRTPGGGFFVWLELPESLDAGEVLEMAKKTELTFIAAKNFFPAKDKKNYIRLSFSNIKTEKIEPGIKRLCELLSL